MFALKDPLRFLGNRFVVGFLLLLPLLLSYLLIGALFDMLMALTAPITDVLPETIFPDKWTHRFTAAGVLIVICLLIGLFDESETGKRIGSWIERKVLNRFAPYALLRSLSSRLSGRDVPGQLQPALLAVAPDVRMLAYIVEEHADGNLTLFVPLGSTPGVGTIQIVANAKVEKLEASMMDTLGCLFNWGSGTEALLKKHAR